MDEYFLSVIMISFMFSLIYILTKWILTKPNCSKRKLLQPPSPPKLPILGNLHQLRPLTHRSFESLGRKYGPVMLLHFGSRPVIVIQSADVAKEDIFAGGTDTASATLAWAMTELLRHPIVMNKLQKEIREILRDKHDVTDNDLEKMHYLKAVVKETLRFHPPIPFLAREAREDVKVMGYEVAGGTMILTNSWAIGRDPASWDEPEKFKPERFLINSSIDFMGLDFELLPFGAGRRRCPGIAFSMANVELVLANLLQKFEWGLPQGIKPEDLDTTENPGGIIHRKNPLFAVATHCYF
ncbi:hypothetical protein RD792_007832 [Penstemon davidsonii]|uniref:Cytochrome P450 n=1 Tax=Penstemon davidsonii TaxID=160366 RepID=A0ABR0D7F0_9LAMI|nr:hypothetical protein RD792_007832 [Penstemon davidsonii]